MAACQPAQIPDHVCIVHGIGTHEDRKLAPGDGERRAGTFAFRAHEIGGEEGARGLRRRGRAGFDPPLQYRCKTVEQRNLRVVDLDLALPAEHVEERHRGIGENLEPHGGALPTSGLELGRARRDARIPLAAELDDLAELENCFRGIEAAKLPGAEGVIELEGYFGIGDCAGL